MKSFRCGPYRWREYAVPAGSPYLASDVGEASNNDGICDPGTKNLYVNEKLKKEEFEITRVHERLHAIWYSYGLDDGDNEEKIVDTLSKGLKQIGVSIK